MNLEKIDKMFGNYVHPHFIEYISELDIVCLWFLPDEDISSLDLEVIFNIDSDLIFLTTPDYYGEYRVYLINGSLFGLEESDG